MILFKTLKGLKCAYYIYDGQAVYTSDIFCESNISYALPYIRHIFLMSLKHTFWFTNNFVLILQLKKFDST